MHVLAIALVAVVVASCSQPTASQLYLDLASASARSDLRSVEQLLERGADPDYYPPTIKPAMSKPSNPPNIAPDRGVLVAPQVGLPHCS